MLTPVTPKTPFSSDIVSGSQDEDFQGRIWTEVQRNVSQMFPHRTSDPISKIVREAVQNQLKNCKVAVLCALVKSFSTCGSGEDTVTVYTKNKLIINSSGLQRERVSDDLVALFFLYIWNTNPKRKLINLAG